MICCGLFFTFMSLLILGGSTTKDSEDTVTGGMAAHAMEKEDGAAGANYKPVDIEDGKGKKVDTDEAHVFPISTATIIFQALMVLASIYFSMLMTNWGNPTVMDATIGFFSANYWSYWVQMTAVWMSQGIYIFSLTAPICFSNREFK